MAYCFGSAIRLNAEFPMRKKKQLIIVVLLIGVFVVNCWLMFHMIRALFDIDILKFLMAACDRNSIPDFRLDYLMLNSGFQIYNSDLCSAVLCTYTGLS